jgi:hypothetical protein
VTAGLQGVLEGEMVGVGAVEVMELGVLEMMG